MRVSAAVVTTALRELYSLQSEAAVNHSSIEEERMNCGKQVRRLEVAVRRPTTRLNAFVKRSMFDMSFAAG